jgi:hypothetical protein
MDLHLLFLNGYKSLLLLPDLGEMRGHFFQVEPGIIGSLSQLKELRPSLYSLKKIPVLVGC